MHSTVRRAGEGCRCTCVWAANKTVAAQCRSYLVPPAPDPVSVSALRPGAYSSCEKGSATESSLDPTGAGGGARSAPEHQADRRDADDVQDGHDGADSAGRCSEALRGSPAAVPGASHSTEFAAAPGAMQGRTLTVKGIQPQLGAMTKT